jgi:hypothetical protein
VKVSKLIEELNRMDQDMDVVVCNRATGYTSVIEILRDIKIDYIDENKEKVNNKCILLH